MPIASSLSLKNYFWILLLAITVNVVGLLMAYIYAVYDTKAYHTSSAQGAFYNSYHQHQHHPAAAPVFPADGTAVGGEGGRRGTGAGTGGGGGGGGGGSIFENSVFSGYNPAERIAQVVRSVMNLRSSSSSVDSPSSSETQGPNSVTSTSAGAGAGDSRDDVNDFHNVTYKNTYVTINGPGRLGNKMFQYAALLAVAHHYGYTPFVPSNNVLMEVFNIRHDLLLDISNDDRYGERNPGEFDASVFEKLNSDKNWTLTGYYQSWKYFTNISKIIKKEFTFRTDILKEAFKVLKKYGQGKKTLIGVHIRRGDMLAQKLRGYNVADEAYINKALGFYRKTVTNPVFLISSDDMNWARNSIKESYDVNFVGGNSLGVDLAILANCQHSVITSGSYGWWAAWLAGGDTIYFSNYPRRNSWLGSIYNKNDYYPEWWIGME